MSQTFSEATETRPRAKLFRRALVLFVVPQCLAVGLLLVVNQLWVSASNEMLSEREQNIFVHGLNEMFNRIGMMSTAMLGRAVAGNPDYQTRIDRETPGLQRDLARLELPKHEHRNHQLVKRQLEKLILTELSTIAKLPRVERITGGTLNLITLKSLPAALAKIVEVRTEISRILDSEAAHLAEIRSREDRFIERIKTAAYATAAFDLLLAVALAVVFASSLSNRLKKLISNAELIANGEKIEATLPGDDEPAYVSRVLEDVARRLEQSAEHRRAIIAMVAHDMRSPLTAAAISLEFLQERSDVLKQYLEKASSDLNSTVSHVEAMLAAERARTTETTTTDKQDEPDEQTTMPTKRASIYKTAAIAGPRIFDKCLIVALLPLAIQIGMLLFIVQQISDTQKITAQARQTGDLNLISNLTKQDTARVIAAQCVYLVNGSPKYRALAEQSKKAVARDFDRMLAIAGGDPAWTETINKGRELAEKTSRKMFQLKPGDPSMLPVLLEVSELDVRNSEAGEQRDRSNALYRAELRAIVQAQARESKARDFISQLLIYSILADIALAAGLLVWFNRDISERWKILQENASALGQGSVMPKKVPGNDEIAYFDRVLHESQEQLETLSRQRQELMATLATGMRSPLTDSLELLKRFEQQIPDHLKEIVQRPLERTQNNIRLVLELIENLLSIEKLAAGSVDLTLSQCDARELAEEALATVSSLAEKKRIILVNQCQSHEFYADRTKIVQVLINYISNALKFSPEGKTVSVASNARDGAVRLAVTDEAGGMDAKTQEHVFDPFFQASGKQASQGFGLGLAICKLIVESHDGMVGVQSQPGKGSIFWLEIPPRKESDQTTVSD